jgi:hypothetical protein
MWFDKKKLEYGYRIYSSIVTIEKYFKERIIAQKWKLF